MKRHNAAPKLSFTDGVLLALDSALRDEDLAATRRALAALPLPLEARAKKELGDCLINCVRRGLPTELAAPLVQAGADPNHQGSSDLNASPLCWAILSGDPSWAKALLALGADPNLPTLKGVDLISLCLESSAGSTEPLIEALLAGGACPGGAPPAARERVIALWEGDSIGQREAASKLNHTPLLRAIWMGLPSLVERLLRAGAPPQRLEANALLALGRLNRPEALHCVQMVESWEQRAELGAAVPEAAPLRPPKAL